MLKHIFLILSLIYIPVWSQNPSIIYGTVSEQDVDHKDPLVGAHVYWKNTQIGVATDAQGKFQIERQPYQTFLVVSYVGFVSDTLEVVGLEALDILLNPSTDIEGVEVSEHIQSTSIDFLDPIKTEKIGEKELLKAACCNLSESFETIPSVDVSFTDAVTGARQIKMLGLSSRYAMVSKENMPFVRGVLGNLGLTLIPGSWIESIQLNRGTGSVVNGFESMTGQINVELWKPESAKKLYLNGYANEGGRTELNLVHAKTLNDRWHTGLFLHGKQNLIRWDRNEDGFLDRPIGQSYIAMNRWKLIGKDGVRFMAGISGNISNMLGGQKDYRPSNSNLWGMEHESVQADVWMKLGKIFEEKPWKSLGVQLNASVYDHGMQFGNNLYEAVQNSMYGNFIYQGMIGNTNHTFKTGASIQWDDVDERFDLNDYERSEYAAGIYYEYTYKYLERFSLVAGLRADYNNLYDLFYTPRLHFRYELLKKLVLRGSSGLGYRTANIFGENVGLMASSRTWIIPQNAANRAYGLNQEQAANIGGSLTYDFTLDFRKGTLGVEYYYTSFLRQVIVDYYSHSNQVAFYDLNGSSYAHAWQVQLDYELIKRLDMRLAYRYSLVESTYDGQKLQVPLVSKERAFVNLAYSTRSKWKFDGTFNWQGPRPVPRKENVMSLLSDPYDYSPDFILVNFQISKSWNDGRWEVYLGVENLLNFRQENPIISADQPFSQNFDASLIWGPIFGRNIYAGFRYKI